MKVLPFIVVILSACNADGGIGETPEPQIPFTAQRCVQACAPLEVSKFSPGYCTKDNNVAFLMRRCGGYGYEYLELICSCRSKIVENQQ